MGKRRVVLVAVIMIWLSLCLEMCYCSKELEGDKEIKAQSWTDWASRKLAEGLSRIRLDSKERTRTSDEDVIDASKYGNDFELNKAKDVVNNEGKIRINLAKSEGGSGGDNSTGEYDPREMIGPGMDYGRDKTTNAAPAPAPAAPKNHNQAQIRKLLGITYDEWTKETASEKAKSDYEAAKENLSQAIGDLGAAIRESNREL